MFKRIRGTVKLDLYPGLGAGAETKGNIAGTWEAFRHIISQVSVLFFSVSHLPSASFTHVRTL